MKQTAAKPGPRATDLTTVKQRLQQELRRRRAAEAALEKSQHHYRQLLEQSHLQQEQLRRLSHQILLTQEEERKHISRELHDEISQILTGINVRLAALKMEAMADAGELKRKIARTQRLVERSVAAVHRFAMELRPAMLDDLGLVPALLTYLKEFRKRTGLPIRFTTVTLIHIEPLDSLQRTVLYRVVQEALTNVAKHAQASLVKVSITAPPGAICMEIADNGKSFAVENALGAKRRRRLGLIGMRERAEMVGGTFAIESVAGQGTTVRVQIPLRNGAKGVSKVAVA